MTLACIDHDAERIAQCLFEATEDGMGTALAVTALLSKHRALSLVATRGAEATRRTLLQNEDDLANRLTLAALDHDADLTGALLSEISQGGMPIAQDVIWLLSRRLGKSLVSAHGQEKTRALLGKTVLDASEAEQ